MKITYIIGYPRITNNTTNNANIIHAIYMQYSQKSTNPANNLSENWLRRSILTVLASGHYIMAKPQELRALRGQTSDGGRVLLPH